MDKRAKIKSGFLFGITMAIFFILRDLLTHDNLTTKNIIITVISGVLGGTLAGLLFGFLFGFLIKLFAKSKFVTKTTKIEIEPDETILFETTANHFKGIEGVGGKLYLTSKRLIFKSHNLNIQNHQLSINLTDIKYFDRYKTLGFANNGFSVTTRNEMTEIFVVEQVEEWINYLTQKKGLHQGAW